MRGLKRLGSPPMIATMRGSPSMPARTKDSGVPPTPTHMGNGFILKRIPRVSPFVRLAHEVIADALGISVVEGGQCREEFTALSFVARRWMQPEIEKRWPQDIRDGHELEVVSRLLPNF